MTSQIPLAKRVFSVQQPVIPDSSTLSYRSAKRIYLPIEAMKTGGLCTGDLVMIKSALSAEQFSNLSTSEDDSKNISKDRFAIGVAWPSIELQSDFVILSLDLILCATVLPGDIINVVPLPPILPFEHRGPGKGIRLPEAHVLTLREVNPACLLDKNQKLASELLSMVHEPSQINLSSNVNKFWEGFLREVLVDRKYLAVGHHISVPAANGVRMFSIDSIHSLLPDTSAQSHPLELYLMTRKTRFTIIPSTTSVLPAASACPSIAPPTSAAFASSTLHSRTIDAAGYDAIGGLEVQVEQIRELVELPLTKPELYSHFNLTPPRGVLLYGPPGTGKTLLASIVAKSTNSTFLTLSASTIGSAYHGEAEQKLYGLFAEAKAKSPTIIVIDEIDGLFPDRDTGGEVDRRVVGAMLACMDGIDEKCDSNPSNLQSPSPQPRVIVVATTNRPNSIDPALRRPGRFDRELEIGIPDAAARLKILQVLLRKTPHNLLNASIKAYADKTHGFVGADLVSLVREAGLAAIKRSIATIPPISLTEMKLGATDIERALLTIRPSAMREVFVETPKTKWSDIGGQETIKLKLRQSVEWPMKYPDTLKRLGINPIRGVLLYGPPGCSKTLIAKALASESGLNFISIKGPEIFNKYVGESEKSIRDLFRKARAAAPSVVFLDEIDAIAISRSSEDSGGSSATGDRVLTSLLTEIDGIEELNGVLVLAATNRPDVIDKALMRPGRLDRILYVGPPDQESRKEIFKINFKKMSVAEDVNIDTLAEMTEGCTGAELVSICQDAAMNAMQKNFDAQFVQFEDLYDSIKCVRKRTTPEVLEMFEKWRDQSGIRSV
ncbi:hypothetical protein O181_020484 [Austropuccinia psidii MF-1]|uniref:AAA+ ATPase domain-containing protein n=1 Tax=Austropuccinia psidii MF-1 TaxID=1389203 RepID=A0A9Q3CBC4_9BASI|nr:hypothetical protein [Austropuccinia psidii MF-1]